MGEREQGAAGGALLTIAAVGITVFLMWNHGRPYNFDHMKDCHETVHLFAEGDERSAPIGDDILVSCTILEPQPPPPPDP